MVYTIVFYEVVQNWTTKLSAFAIVILLSHKEDSKYFGQLISTIEIYLFP